MKILKEVRELRTEVQNAKKKGLRTGLVPTMGFLHEGHLSLVEQARSGCDLVFVSIFVNPLQFNNEGDLTNYPVDIPRDIKLLEEYGTSCVFLPDYSEVYSPRHQTRVNPGELGKELEGAFRPGHFSGVATVVSILFNLVQPDIAVFGEKDFQQLRIIEQMVDDLKFNIEIRRGKTVREPDGLAKSSRNVRLNQSQREQALLISGGLQDALTLFRSGEKNVSILESAVRDRLARGSDINVEYVSLVNEETLSSVAEAKEKNRLLVAASVGPVRLIDNISLENPDT